MSYLKRIAKPINTYYEESQLKKLNNVLYKNMAKIVCGNKEIEPYIAYSVNIPLTVDTFVYDGTEKTPTWVGFDDGIMAVSGDTSATNAGEYTVTFTLIDNRYFWVDGTTTPKQVTWSIAKADNVITLSANAITVQAGSGAMPPVAVTATVLDGTVDVDTKTTQFFEITVSGNAISVQGVDYDPEHADHTVNVIVPATNNYNAASTELAIHIEPAKTYLQHIEFTDPDTYTIMVRTLN